MSDNTTAHKASEYEAEVQKTIPFHDEMLRTAIDVVLAVKTPKRWLDTGCGPGKLVELARARAPETEFWLADPSEAMLAIARARNPELPPDRFVLATSQDLPVPVEGLHPSSSPGPQLAALRSASFDAITAMQCHHYGDADARARAVARCRELLAPGGVFVTFENVRAETEEGQAIQRKRWAEYQRRAGRDEATVAKHLSREGVAFFPIRVSEHLALLSRVGFSRVEIVWRAFGQAGFYALRD
ncbi:MAG TPA: class I SAM-dependent methyltransferase [Polyangiaceae bacterium]|jgi:tRNA (cmo5U34)-methyltransferase